MAKERRQSLLEAIADLRAQAERGINPCDDVFQAEFPDLWELMTACMVDENKAVQPGIVTVMNQNGDWAFKASSQAYGVSKTVLVKTWAEGLARLNASLRDPVIPWQVYVKRSVKERKIKQQEKKDLRRNGS
jgi:hypothetical protein